MAGYISSYVQYVIKICFIIFQIEEKVLIKEEEEKQAVPTKKPIDPILNDDDDELDKDVIKFTYLRPVFLVKL